jgi:hypothetical protein
LGRNSIVGAVDAEGDFWLTACADVVIQVELWITLITYRTDGTDCAVEGSAGGVGKETLLERSLFYGVDKA